MKRCACSKSTAAAACVRRYMRKNSELHTHGSVPHGSDDDDDWRVSDYSCDIKFCVDHECMSGSVVVALFEISAYREDSATALCTHELHVLV